MPPFPPAIVFGFPAAFYFAAAAVPVALAFFYRRRARVVEVPAVLLWQQIGRPVDVRSFAALLRRLISLLVQLALLALLVFALSDPWPRRQAVARVVVVVDVSATMQTREPGGADPFSAAKEKALASLAALPDGAEAAVLLAGATPVLAQPPTTDLASARRAVQEAIPQDVDGDLRTTLRAAAAFTNPALPCEVVVCSDFTADDPAVIRTGWLYPATLTLAGVGSDQPDAAVTDVWAEADFPRADAPPAPAAATVKARVTATLLQRGMAGRTVPVRLEIDGRTVATRDVTLADGPTRIEFSTDATAGAAAKVQVDAGDVLPADDAGYAVFAAPDRADVCLVTAGDAPLEQALRADPSVQLTVAAPADYRGGGASVVVFDAPAPAPLPPDGAGAKGYLFVAAPDPFGWAEPDPRGWVDVPPVTHWAGEQTIMADLDPTGLQIQKALRLKWQPGATPRDVLCADATPLVVELAPPTTTQGTRAPRCVYWLFDPKAAGLARRTSFLLMLWNTIDYLADRPPGREADSHLTGRPLQLPDAAGAKIVGPDGKAVTARAAAPAASTHRTGGAAATVYDTGRQGIYTVDRGGRREMFAVNLSSTRGTRPVGKPAAQPDAGAAARSAAGAAWWRAPLARPSWDTIILAAAGFQLLEWLLFHRRVVQVG